MEENIYEILKKYPPREMCDEWIDCIEEADRETRELHCEDCDNYWCYVDEVMKEEMKNQFNLF